MVLLVHLIDVLRLSHIVYELDDRSEISWAVQIDVFKRVFVCFDYTVETVDFRVENVSIKGKTVRCSVCRWRDRRAEAERRDLFV